MTSAAAAAPNGTTIGSSFTAVTSASDSVPASDPTEMYRVIQILITKTAQAIASAMGETTAKTPAAVATPFPPRNRSHTGYTWPTTDATPATIGVAALTASRWATSTATAPFTASRHIATTAGRTPSVRNRLDAPTLPLPTRRKS